MNQKMFMDIDRIREKKMGDDLPNIGGFDVGDQIVIQEKVDGANASIRYDIETHTLKAFSRRKELDEKMSLRGFWDYVQTLNSEEFEQEEQYVFFGEWLVKNAVKYKPEAYSKWYVYDVFDTKTQLYLSAKQVKEICEKHNWIYVNTFYVGPFISWEHCRSYVGKSDIAVELGEGVVVKNQTKLNSPDSKDAFVLKIVSEKYQEITDLNRKRKHKGRDPLKKKEMEEAKRIAECIVTRRRVEKELYKLIDEGLIPEKISLEDKLDIVRLLPPRVFNDCNKEEPNMVNKAGKSFGKYCSSITRKFIRDIVTEKIDVNTDEYDKI